MSGRHGIDSRSLIGRRAMLGGGVAALGALLVTGRFPGLGSSSPTPGEGTFGATFDFTTGVVDIVGASDLPDGVALDVTVTALSDGAPMTPGGDAAVRTVRTTTAGDGSFGAHLSFDGATDGNADQLRVVIDADDADHTLHLTGLFSAPSSPDGPDGPQLGPASSYTRSSSDPDTSS